MDIRFEFTIPNEKKKLYNRFALLLFILNAAALFIRFYYFNQSGSDKRSEILIYLIPLLLIIFLSFIAYHDSIRKYFKSFLIASCCLSLFWLVTGPWWIAPITLLLTFFFVTAQRELKIIVSPSHIRYPSFPPKKIQWEELNNLVLKDGLLTIDFKNDTLIQQYPEAKMNMPDESEFNEFCRERLGIWN